MAVAAVTADSSSALPANAGTASQAINPWLIAASVMLATFMEVLDTAIASVALPYIAGSLSASNDEATWVLTSYLVAKRDHPSGLQLVLAALWPQAFPLVLRGRFSRYPALPAARRRLSGSCCWRA